MEKTHPRAFVDWVTSKGANERARSAKKVAGRRCEMDKEAGEGVCERGQEAV